MLFLLLEALFLQQVIKYSSFQSSPIMSLNIDISSQLLSFKKHLQIPNNTRILFSGPFGSGKTYFMERFFEQNETDYIKIKINPIHYSVASNEDIFELIKYDILFELLGRPEIDEMEEDNSLSLVLASFILSKSDGMAKLGASAIGLTDPTIGKIGLGVLTVSKLMDKFEKYKKSTNKGTQNLIIDFLKTVTKKPGIREEDLITILLCEVVALVKEKSKKKIVLVIDDLDRIDPEHVFRILNVFGAHFDIIKEGNKFDFDHVMLVCDENNIRNIFKAKYGVNADYNGYIDKFFSKNIFNFNIALVLMRDIDTILHDLPKSHNTFTRRDNVYELVRLILKSAITANLLQVRNLVKLTDKDIAGFKGVVKISDRRALTFQLCQAFQILGCILGGYQALADLLNALKKYSNDSHHFYEYQPIDMEENLKHLLPILSYRVHKFQIPSSDLEFIYTDSYGDKFIFKVELYNNHRQPQIISAKSIEQPATMSNNFFEMLERAYYIFKDDFDSFHE